MYHTFFKCVLKYYIYINIVCMQRVFTSFFWLICLHIYLPPKKKVTRCKQASLCWRWPGQGQQPVTAGLELFFAQSVLHFLEPLRVACTRLNGQPGGHAGWPLGRPSGTMIWARHMCRPKKKDGKQKKKCARFWQNKPHPQAQKFRG